MKQLTSDNPLNTLFEPDDAVWLGKEHTFTAREDGVTRMVPLQTWWGTLGPLTPLTEFFCINPLVNFDASGSVRRDINVAQFRNLVFESDSLSVELQRNIIPEIAKLIPIKTVTFSGGKSFHMTVSLMDTPTWKPHTESGTRGYTYLWKALATLIETKFGLKPDPSTSHAGQVSRTPLATRTKSGLEQAPFLGFSPRYATFEALMELARPYYREDSINARRTTDIITSLSDFEQRLKKNENKHLHNKLRWPHSWAGPNNMYKELFKLALWAKDDTGVTEEVLLTYLQQKVFPAILQKGYPRDVTEGIRKAYIWRS